MSKKILLGIIVLLSSIGYFIYSYIYKDHRDISTENTAYTVNISGLQKEFTTNEKSALLKYQDQTIELTGQITSVDFKSKAVVLNDKIFATFNENLPKNIIRGKTLKIKGRFLGYDELLEEFKIDQSSIVH